MSKIILKTTICLYCNICYTATIVQGNLEDGRR